MEKPAVAQGDGWTQAELEASVEGYLQMLKWELAGKGYSKAEVNAELRGGALANRTKASVELRMQNISAVLNEMGLPWIEGYKPAKNVGANVKEQIRSVLAGHGYVEALVSEPTANPVELEKRTRALRRAGLSSSKEKGQIGQLTPKSVAVTIQQFVRDPHVRATILEGCHGRCEACGQPAPFSNEFGEPFLEVHHVIPLAAGGPDTVDNAVAICPNCHRRLHLGRDRVEYRDRLYEAVTRLMRHLIKSQDVV